MNQKELASVLKAKYGRVKLAAKGFVRIPCPTCAPAHARKMKRYVHADIFYSKCYICEEDLRRDDVVGQQIERTHTDEEYEEVEHPQSRILPCKKLIPINQLPDTHPAKVFLLKDHLSDFDRYWNDYRIGFVPADGAIDIHFPESDFTVKTYDSLVFPVAFQKKMVGWQLRFVPGTWHGDKMSKMKYLHVFPKGNYLFNYDIAKKFPTVIVVEGIKKALKLPNCVATLGKGISERQYQLIQEWKRIVLLLDGDEKTQKQAEEIEATFRANGRYCLNINPMKYGYPSPDEIPQEQMAIIVAVEWKMSYGQLGIV